MDYDSLSSRLRKFASARLALKAIKVFRRPLFFRALVLNGVAAAVEHTQALSDARPKSLIDIGANKGQFSLAFRARSAEAQIYAFEPLPRASEKFQKVFRNDPATTLFQVAISDQDGSAPFFVTDQSDSSSLLKAGQGQKEAFGISYVSSTVVTTRTLHTCVRLDQLEHPVLLKIDVQGAELKVLRGCGTLTAIDFILIELSYVMLYDRQSLAGEVFSYLSDQGFRLVGVYNQVRTDKFGPTQADFLFENSVPIRLAHTPTTYGARP